jgi:DNA-binding Lrp family transcriptional regulator
LSNDEIKILDIIKANSRKTVLDISKEIKLTPRVVSSKIKKLERIGIISGFKTKINMAELGFQPCIALINFNKYTELELKKFINHCKQRDGINHLVKQIGKYDIKLTIDAQDVINFYNIVDELREEFHFIKKITTLISK